MATKKTFLENKKVILKPIVKAGGMNAEGHDGHFMYTGTEVQFVLPYNAKKGRLETILTPEEQDFFEEVLDEDLSIHKKKDNFWHSFRIRIRKDDKLMEMGYELDLSDPIDNLRWRVLKLNPAIAPSWVERNKRGEYKFALVDANELIETKARKTDKKKKAYIWLGSVEHSPSKMINFLRVYGVKPAPDANPTWLKQEIDKYIENDLDKVLKIIDDKDYNMKLFIEDAVDAGAIVKKNRKYFLPGGDPINDNDPSLKGTVSALNKYKEEGDDIYLRIEAQIENDK